MLKRELQSELNFAVNQIAILKNDRDYALESAESKQRKIKGMVQGRANESLTRDAVELHRKYCQHCGTRLVRKPSIAAGLCVKCHAKCVCCGQDLDGTLSRLGVCFECLPVVQRTIDYALERKRLPVAWDDMNPPSSREVPREIEFTDLDPDCQEKLEAMR